MYQDTTNQGVLTCTIPAGAFVLVYFASMFILLSKKLCPNSLFYNCYKWANILSIFLIVESQRDGQMTACEVLLFHHEDMGIPWEIAKLGVRQGMWGCVRRIEPGLRAYQLLRSSPDSGPISHHAEMAHINTKFNAEEVALREEETNEDGTNLECYEEPKKPQHWIGNVPKVLAIGGAVALACTVDHGLVTKAVIFGVARQFARIGKRL